MRRQGSSVLDTFPPLAIASLRAVCQRCCTPLLYDIKQRTPTSLEHTHKNEVHPDYSGQAVLFSSEIATANVSSTTCLSDLLFFASGSVFATPGKPEGVPNDKLELYIQACFDHGCTSCVSAKALTIITHHITTPPCPANCSVILEVARAFDPVPGGCSSATYSGLRALLGRLASLLSAFDHLPWQ